jgi:membrane protease YdiL (CAAX protease family)
MLSSISRTAFLRLEWALSLALIAVALIWAELRHLPLGRPWTLAPREIAAGVTAAALLWLCIPLLRRSTAIRRLWDGALVPFARGLRTMDILAIALLSGISEELFFRGVLLPEIGLVASSVVFGALHALTPLYALWAGVTGAGFALLTIQGESLVVAIIAHATYNAGALFALRHWQVRTPVPELGENTRTAPTRVASFDAFR